MPAALTAADKAKLKVVDIENQLGVQRYLEDTLAEVRCHWKLSTHHVANHRIWPAQWLLESGLEENLTLSNV